MTKLIAALGALFLFGSVGTTPAGGDVCQVPLSAPAPLRGEAHAIAALEEVAVAYAKSGSTGAGRVGEMSDEEKERRRQVCERENQFCCDRCRDYKKGSDCYAECSRKLGECMKPIR
jgi:hypothetical protein